MKRLSQANSRLFSVAIAVAALAFGSLLEAPSAMAQDPMGAFLGGFFGGGYGGGYRQPYRHRSYSSSRPSATRPSQQADPAPSASDSARALASLAPPSSSEQLAVLKSVFSSQSLGAVGAGDEDSLLGRANSGESDRDYTSKIEALIKRIKTAQEAQRSSKEGDVTEHAILDSLNESVKRANLQRFETFLGENWSAERLRGMIIDRVSNEIGELFDGTNKGAVSMNDLDSIIQKAARNVYSRLFETSELLAANRGSTLFVQRLYQIHGELLNGDAREDAEQLLIEASNAGIAAVDPLLRRDQNAFALRYRAQRITFDCLSDNIEAITSSDSGMASRAEIEKHILDVAQQQCSKWVTAQLLGPEGKVKPQDPMPLRVIWSADGPKDDPSMYGHASDQI